MLFVSNVPLTDFLARSVRMTLDLILRLENVRWVAALSSVMSVNLEPIHAMSAKKGTCS